MGLLNYTTEVPSSKSIGQIIEMLIRKGAQRIVHDYTAGGQILSISFTLSVGGLPVMFQLPAKVDAAFAVMYKVKPFSYSYHRGTEKDYKARVREQAERTAWRIVKDWVEVQLAMVELGQAEAAQVFMPYAIAQDGVTMWDRWLESHQKQLGPGAA